MDVRVVGFDREPFAQPFRRKVVSACSYSTTPFWAATFTTYFFGSRRNAT